MKKVIIPAAVLIVLTAAVITVIALNPFSSDKSANGASAADGNSTASGDSLSDTLAELYSSMLEDKQVVATVNGEEVYNTDLAIYKADRKFTELSVGSTTHIDKAGNFKYNDRQMLEFKIEQMLAAQQAQKDGHSLTDSELDKLVESNLLQQDKLIPNYSERLIKACGMSRDEYKNKVAIPKIKEEMLFSNFRQDFSLSSDQSGGYEQKIAELKKSADIKYFI